MNKREALEAEWAQAALARHWSMVTEAEFLEVKQAHLEAMENRLRRIAALNEEIAPNSASFPGKVQSRTHSEG